MKKIAIAVILLSTSLTQAWAQQADPNQAQGMNPAAMTAMIGGSGMPIEAGQSAFAAIQEIVRILLNDPTTDWSKVNIEALRQHLIDMNNVTLYSHVQSKPIKGGIEFVATGSGDTKASIRRMLSAHAKTMNGNDGWSFTSIDIPGGANLTAIPSASVSINEVRGLGFIGILSLGMHHQMHHLMLAKGTRPHG